MRVKVVETNKVATMPVRGAGYPEAAFVMERLLDEIALRLGLDRAEVRRRNIVPAEKMPYVTPLKTRAGSTIAYDSGDFPRCLRHGARGHRLCGLCGARAGAAASGRHLGIGIGNGVKGSGRGPFESGIVRIGRSGRISVYTGAMPMGQGIRTALAQICAEQFGVPTDTVTVMAGDTAVIPYGQGGFASRQTVTAGSSVHLAASAVREKVLEVAAHLLETERRGSRDARRPGRGGRRARQRTCRSAKWPKRSPACQAIRCRENSSPGSRACRVFCRTR